MHTSTNKDKRRVTFTYISPQIRKVTNIFRNTNVKIAFKWWNTMANWIKPSTNHNTPLHNKWGIYQLTCNTCHLSYVGQTSRSLCICFQEHVGYIRNNNPQSEYAQHILQNQHEYGQITSIITLLKPLNNPSLFIPYKQNYIQSLHQEGKLIPEQNSVEINPLFKTVINPQPPNEQTGCASAWYTDTTPTWPHRNPNTHRNKVGAISNSQHQSTLAKHCQSTNKTHCTHENT